MKEIISVIESVGFPIALSIYLLIRFEKKIDELNKSILALHEDMMEILNKK